MKNGITVDGRIEAVARGEHGDELSVKLDVLPATPGNAGEVEPLDVVLFDESEYLCLRAVLRDVFPRSLVDLRRFPDHAEGEGLRRADDLFIGRKHDGVVREALVRSGVRRREVEEVLERLCSEWLESHVPAIGRFRSEHRDCAAGDLQEEIEFLRGRGRIGSYDAGAVDGPGEELFRDILIELLVSLL